ncbi:glycosyltransferase involved in cell wall biosynthesis [Pontibacter ummariensis]|uniref:Glycosyltransferase involved in cell wall bisynthesis n=1 Tax=Pontibacter ummariensis TaxID=1610492 RepID=A0A239AYF2_9BACT|nr:glycosyltransferase family 2 protein [Pontibacter ummariensis]PRY16177.1 glycosyltransferase involved in cell wall biosynthesis [Pontibacter ummariensis]SNS00529.1 Glycosyltransferase involved in cell wall bisynthesis [Pontibacter ummariensis]
MQPYNSGFPVSCYILTYNSARYLPQILQALEEAVEEVVLVDSGSTDATEAIASQYGARLVYRKFDNFIQQRNFGLEQCRHKWVLSLDSDEVPSADFVAQLQQLKKRLGNEEGPEAYRMERHWVLFGQEVRTFYPISSPDYPVRLFRKDVVTFGKGSNFVHEKPEGFTKAEVLAGAVHHYSCDSVEELYRKLNLYTSLAAKDMGRKGKKASLAKLIFSPVAAWFKWYLKKGGWRDGNVGFILGRYAYDYTYQKYLKLYLSSRAASELPKEHKQAIPGQELKA